MTGQLTCFICGREVDIDECERFQCASDENVHSIECHQCTPPDDEDWTSTFDDEAQQVIGARADIRWLDSGEVVNRYFSWGDCPGESTHDEFGVPDDEIFFYVGDTPGFEELFSTESGNDFVVLRDTVEYVTRPYPEDANQ